MCTIFVAGRNGTVLAGNNEDNDASFNPDTRIWLSPPEEGRHGIVFVGYAGVEPQGGLNDQGLFFDGAAIANGANILLGDRAGKTAILELIRDGVHELGTGEGPRLLDEMMSRCADVEAALAILQTSLQANGIPHHVLRGSGDFQVATNFQQSVTAPEKVTCKRYEIVERALSSNEPLNVDLFRSLLRATHQEGKCRTFYSDICDLKRGRIYLYQRGDYERVVELDLDEELQKGKRELKIIDLFKQALV